VAPTRPTRRQGAATNTTSTARVAVARAEAPRITADPIILGDWDLQDTESFVGCFAYFEGQIGLSFKGLQQEICIELKGKAYTAQPGTFQPLQVSQGFAACIYALLQIWHAFQTLLRLEVSEDSEDNELASARSQLNYSYDSFVRDYGSIHDNAHLFKLEGIEDNRLQLLRGLETEESHEKANIFFSRTHFPPAPATEQLYFDEEISERLIKAFAKTLNDRGQIDINHIAMLSGIDPELAEQTLVDLDIVVREPILPEHAGHRDIARNASAS
jgi:hypothetical protein